MKLAAGLILAAFALASASEVTPVQKVIQLLDGMLSKGKKMKEDEQLQFAAYKTWCEDTISQKSQDIKDAEEAIATMKALIEKLTADVKLLTKEIAHHDEDISVWNGNIKAATAVREMEKADYDALHKDYSESISALQRAIEVLGKPAKNTAQAGSLIQLSDSMSVLRSSTLIPERAKKVIEAFLQTSEFPTVDLQVEGLSSAVSAPEAMGYEFQSQGIIEMMEKLLDKFEGELTKIENAERTAQAEFDLIVKDMTMQIADATATRDDKIETKAKKLEKKAKTEGELKETIAVMEADKKYLAEVTATCQTKAADFESRQALRTEEIAAIEKAIEIMSSDEIKTGEGHLPTLVQVKKAISFAQLRSNNALAEQDLRGRLTDFLRSAAKEINSRVLLQVALHAEKDPFKKVKQMIKDLIARLMSEAAEEAEHKQWCDEELSTNEVTRNKKTADVETLHAEIDELEATIAKLTEDLANLAKAIAELDAAMAKATKIRQEEKAENAQTVSDAGEAQEATAKAIAVLKEFYAKAGEATAFVQQPEIFDSPYKGMQGENGGVIGMLEVIESDFARLEAETKAEEATAQKEYEEFMITSKEDKAAKERESEEKTAKKQDEEQMLTVKLEDLDGTQKELDAALQYFDKLKPSCIDSGVSYDDRVARRKEEIASLQEALEILGGKEI